LDPERAEWSKIGEILPQRKSEYYMPKAPSARYGHSFHAYRNFLVMFGGANTYNMKIKKRETFDDILLYDINKDRWLDPLIHRNDESLCQHIVTSVPQATQYDDNSLSVASVPSPFKRYAHASAILGNCLVIHGGIDGDENILI
jgi:Galactose oxidase, central domain